MSINQREITLAEGARRRISILVEFPEERLETIVVQWEGAKPSALVQLKRDPKEPLRFAPGARKDLPSEAGPETQPETRENNGAQPPQISKGRLAPALDSVLLDFVDPCTGRIFGKEAYLADIVVSSNAFSLLQPEPDLVLDPTTVWEARAEALRALGLTDEPLAARVEPVPQSIS